MKTIARRSFLRQGVVSLFGLWAHPWLGAEVRGEAGQCEKGKRVVVIGSGLTGLCTGAILARQGFDITILEAHPELIGGHSRCYSFDNLTVCVGPQYVWNFGEGDIGQKVLKYLSLENQVEFSRMDEKAFENFLIGKANPIPIPMGLKEFERTAINYYPENEEALRLFFSIVTDLFEASRVLEKKGLYLSNQWRVIWHTILDVSISLGQKLSMLRFSRSTLDDLYDHCGLSGEIEHFLYGHGGIFAENQSDVSAVLYAAGTGSYHSGSFVPKGGFSQLVNGLCDVIRTHNGTILNNKTVIRIETDDNVATSIRCSDGSLYQCDIVVSNLAPRQTCCLLGDCNPAQYSYAPSNSLASCFMVIRDSESIAAKLRLRNFWWQDGQGEVDFRSPDMTAPPRMLFIGSPSANAIPPVSSETNMSLVVFCPGNFDQSKLAVESGEEFHQQIKNTLTENIIEILDNRLFPGIREKVVHTFAESPWDLYTQTGAESGNVYGKRLTPDSVLSNDLGSINNIKNLYVGCASIGLPGVATCFRTATIVSKKISGIDIEE